MLPPAILGCLFAGATFVPEASAQDAEPEESAEALTTCLYIHGFRRTLPTTDESEIIRAAWPLPPADAPGEWRAEGLYFEGLIWQGEDALACAYYNPLSSFKIRDWHLDLEARPLFPRGAVVLGSTDDFVWSGMTDGEVVLNAGPAEPPFVHRVKFVQELLDFCQDPVAAFEDRWTWNRDFTHESRTIGISTDRITIEHSFRDRTSGIARHFVWVSRRVDDQSMLEWRYAITFPERGETFVTQCEVSVAQVEFHMPKRPWDLLESYDFIKSFGYTHFRDRTGIGRWPTGTVEYDVTQLRDSNAEADTPIQDDSALDIPEEASSFKWLTGMAVPGLIGVTLLIWTFSHQRRKHKRRKVV